MALAALGILCGIKTSGLLYYGALLVVTVGVVATRERLARRSFRLAPPWRSAEILAVSVGGCALVLQSTPWYLRNFIELGNPLGAVQIAVGNWVLFPGYTLPASIYRTTLAALFHFSDPQHLKILLHAVALELGLPFIVTGIFMLLGTFRRARTVASKPPGNLLALWAVMIATAVLYWITPYSGDNGSHDWQITSWIGQGLRYAIPSAVMFVILGVEGLACFGRHGDALAMMAPIATLIVATLGSQTRFRIVLFFGLLAGIVMAHVIMTEVNWTVTRARVAIFIMIVATVGAFVPAVSALRAKRAEDRREAYRGVPAFIEAQVGMDEVIGYVLSHQSYLFYGEHPIARSCTSPHARPASTSGSPVCGATAWQSWLSVQLSRSGPVTKRSHGLGIPMGRSAGSSARTELMRPWFTGSQEMAAIRTTRRRTPQQAHAAFAISKSSRRLKPSVAIATSGPGRARADAMQCEHIKPWVALTTSLSATVPQSLRGIPLQAGGSQTETLSLSTFHRCPHTSGGFPGGAESHGARAT